MYTHVKKKQACEDLHTHTNSRVCLGTCDSTRVQQCLHVPICSVCLLLTVCYAACLQIHLMSHLQSLPASVLVCAVFPNWPSVFAAACLSFCGSAPQNVPHIKGTFLSPPQTESSHYISLFVSSAGDELKSEM